MISKRKWNIIQSGFSIVILVLKLRSNSKFQKEPKLQKLSFDKEYSDLNLSKLIGRQRNIMVSLREFMRRCWMKFKSDKAL